MTCDLTHVSIPIPSHVIHPILCIIHQLESSLAEASSIAERARSSWTKFRQERDFHRMHHRRVVQEKNTLVMDIKVREMISCMKMFWKMARDVM